MKPALFLASAALCSLLLAQVSPALKAAEVITQNQAVVTFFETEPSPFHIPLLTAFQQTWPENAFRNQVGTGQDPLELMATAGSGRFLVAPKWSWEPLELSGPHYRQEEGSESWVMRAEARLKLNLNVYRSTGNIPERLGEINDSWLIGKDIPVRNMDQLLTIVKQATGTDVDLQNPEHQKLVLDVVRQVPSFKVLETLEPTEYLAEELPQALGPANFESLMKALKQQQWLEDARPAQTSPDQQQAPSTDTPDNLGLNILFRGGTVPLWLSGQFSQLYGPDPISFFTPQFQLEVEYDVGRFFNLPGFYVSLGGGSSTPVQQSMMDQGGGQFIGQPSPSALAIVGDLGLGYLWNLDPFQIHFGLRGGMLYGLLMEPFPTQPGMSTTTSFGGTLLVGGRWQVAPAFTIGLDVGGRFYSPGVWMNSGFGFPQPVPFPPLTSYGPVIQFVAGLTL